MASPKKLGKRARLIRSKNADQFWVTFDIIFANDADFERVVSAKILTKNWIDRTYQVLEDAVILVGVLAANATKISFPRPLIQGDPGETNMYSGQQYAPLLDLHVR